jgi:hypothetical protein
MEGGGVCRGLKKTFRPYVLFSNPEFPLHEGVHLGLNFGTNSLPFEVNGSAESGESDTKFHGIGINILLMSTQKLSASPFV